ncbi:MAG: Nramp family divalent metal transporter [Janthinobacterium lividum]
MGLESMAATGMSARTDAAIREVLAGRQRGLRSTIVMVGPAVVASIAYMDPGNFATNIQAGAKFGYTLLWVVVAANLVAMLFQALSAKLGIVTGSNLAELCRQNFPRRVTVPMWLASEVAAMATDLAEFLGGAIGLSLLLGIPLLAGMLITALATYAILLLERRGYRSLEIGIAVLVGVIGVSYLAEVLIAPVDWAAAGLGIVVPRIPAPEALTIAVGIIGATVMPHALYLHSGLTQHRAPARDDEERATLLRYSNREVRVALTIAGLINMAMVVMAAAAFHLGHDDVAEIGSAYHTLTPLLGPAAAGIFLVSLLASGLSSSAVGTIAGQMIMQGFVEFRIPLWLRRLITMAPAFVVVALGVDSTKALVMSQVVLSFVLPLPMVALVMFTRRADIMGRFANSRLTDMAAILGTVVIVALNVVLILQTAGVSISFLTIAD